MRFNGWKLVVLVIFISSQSCISRKLSENSFKISSEAAREDVALLKSILEANHPSLYWYTTKDSLDNAFTSVIGNIRDSITEKDLKNSIASVIAKIHCGHTAVRFSRRYSRFLSLNSEPQFPLSVKTWNDTMVIVASRYSNDTIFKRGSLITAINGVSNKKVLDSMFSLLSTDGYADNFKSQIISFNFPASYRNTFDIPNAFAITHIDSTGKVRTDSIAAFMRDTSARGRMIERVQRRKAPSRRDIRSYQLLAKRNLTIDTTNIAYMRLNTFSDAKLRSFFKGSFKRLRKEKINDLVIDLRENGGGNITASAALARYISDHSFRLADTVAAISRRLRFSEYIKPSLIYQISMFFTTRKRTDNRYHFGYLERHVYNPKKRNRFNGNVYILQGGYTFSASTMFIQAIKHQKNVITVGEETGGGSYGNSAVHNPTITLPNSKIRVTLPLFRVVFDEDQRKTGRGVIPEVHVGPSVEAIRNGKDIKVLKVYELIMQNRFTK